MKVKIFQICILAVFPALMFAQKENDHQSKSTLGLNFECIPKVDLRIYSADPIELVPDNKEFSTGAVGTTNSGKPIKVEFLAIDGVTSGAVQFTFTSRRTPAAASRAGLMREGKRNLSEQSVASRPKLRKKGLGASVAMLNAWWARSRPPGKPVRGGGSSITVIALGVAAASPSFA